MSRTTHRVATTQGSAIIPDFLSKVSSKVVNFVSRSQAERQLQALDDRLLADIGLKRSDIRKMVWGATLERGSSHEFALGEAADDSDPAPQVPQDRGDRRCNRSRDEAAARSFCCVGNTRDFR
jgi:uncharacterized protein YjiS (DUF1127 family)